MSEFHSTISRRDFMKAVGLAGASIGVASAVSPVFHDLDEVSSSAPATWKRPWYVKQTDEPTMEIDWDKLERYDVRKSIVIDPQEAQQLQQAQWNRWDQGTLDNKPGYRMRDRSLSQTCWLYQGGSLTYSSWTGPVMNALFYREFESDARWAALPKWEATPEENSKTLRAALVHLGAYQVAFLPLDAKTKKLILSYGTMSTPILQSGAREIVFEDVDKGYETTTKIVIPNKCKWAIVYTVAQSNELSRRTTTPLGVAGFARGYSDLIIMEGFTQQFLKGLGYQGLAGNTFNAMVTGFGVLSGLGESSRASFMISPEYGATVRQSTVVFTDLPLAPTNPIDAGMFKFCSTCKKCAEVCPSSSINKASEPSWDCVTGPWNNPGIKGFKNNYASCFKYWLQGDTFGCGICQGSCVFTKFDDAAIHEVVKATVASTPLFNGFFRTMDDFFGYGMRDDMDSWWDEERPGNLRRY
ncbi:reductive dehalogenase [Dehalococcoides mccartyi]|jgi:reductive dehalogenase|nr:reductive dehalogenase [Dehalococcoides mccartyi]AII60319.1 dehalogenase [Dehalococcoides mccartyi CG5]